MRKAMMGSALALLVGLVVHSIPASAQSDECQAFRTNIAAMEASPHRPPGWYKLSVYLRATYKESCGAQQPTRRTQEFWFTQDGRSTGVPAGKPRPANGAYATTLEIGAACAGTDPGNPSVCALLRGLEERCRTPDRGAHVRLCAMLLDDVDIYSVVPPDPDEPPDYTLTLDGRSYAVPAFCGAALAVLEGPTSDPRHRANAFSRLGRNCPDLVAAIERRLGMKGDRNDSRFLTALEQLVQSGFAPRGRGPVAGSPSADPGFQRMCAQAKAMQDKCTAHFNRYGGELQRHSQSYRDCAKLYGHVAAMCGNPNVTTFNAPFRPLVPVRPTPAPPAAKPPAGNTAKSMPPPAPQPVSPALQSMSASCKAQLNAMLEGTDRGDAAKASAAYDNLRKNCDASIRAMAQEANLSLPERRTGALTQRYFGTCIDTGSCGVAPSNPEQQARAAQWGYEWGQLVNAGFALAGAAMGVAGMYVASPGGQFSTMNQRARPTYGQGGPVYTAPRTGPSTITGGSR